MATFSLINVALLALLYVLYRLVSSFVTKRQFQAFAKQHGCEEPLNISGPFPWAFKRLFRMLKLAKTGEDFMDDIIAADYANANTIKFSVFDGKTTMGTIEPANLQAILATQFQDFATGHRRHAVFSPVIGKSIFSSDGPFWEHSRALFRPQFSRENLNDLEMTDRATADLIRAIGRPDDEGWTDGKEMMPLLYNFTLDTATDFLFGESVDSQAMSIAAQLGEDPAKTSANAEKLKMARDFAESFKIMNHYLLQRIRLQGLYWLGDGLEFRKAIRTQYKFTEPFVQLAVNAAGKPQEGKKQSLLHNLASQTQNRTELRNQTLSILVAGRDTTSATLGWCMIRLALHNNIFNKIRHIILEDFPAGTEITFAKLKGCRYLQHFLSEILRLHPIVPLNQRMAIKNTTLPVGGGPDQKSPIAVPKGQVILFSVYLMQRRKDLWGEDAAEFRPERWEERRVPAWQWLPFLGGPRVCIGQQFALIEASFVLVRLLQEFDAMEPVDPVEMAKLKKGLGVTMWPGDGARVRFRKAKVE